MAFESLKYFFVAFQSFMIILVAFQTFAEKYFNDRNAIISKNNQMI